MLLRLNGVIRLGKFAFQLRYAYRSRGARHRYILKTLCQVALIKDRPFMEIRLKILYFKPRDGCGATAERCSERELITPRITGEMFVPFHHHCLYLWLAVAAEERPGPER